MSKTLWEKGVPIPKTRYLTRRDGQAPINSKCLERKIILKCQKLIRRVIT